MLARRWAMTCPGHHEKSNHLRWIPGRFSVGQNLAFGFESWRDAISAWHNEVNVFTYGNMADNVQSQVGHYTMMVWARVNVIGCAAVMCNNQKRKLHFCNYGPGGNKGNWAKPYKTGSVSECPKHRDGNLCACKDVCLNNGEHNMATCKCVCPANQPFTKPPTCAMNCESARSTENRACSIGAPGNRTNQYCQKFSNWPPLCPIFCNVCPKTDNSGERMKTTLVLVISLLGISGILTV